MHQSGQRRSATSGLVVLRENTFPYSLNQSKLRSLLLIAQGLLTVIEYQKGKNLQVLITLEMFKQ